MQFEITGVSDFTSYLVTNHVNVGSSMMSASPNLCGGVEAGLICNIHRTTHT